MIRTVAQLISSISQSLTLLPGTLISTGSPGGAGRSRKPPLYLTPGTEVTVTLSFERAKTAPAREKTNEFSVLNGARILLCEDHPLNAEIAVRLLRARGCSVECVENGKLGLNAFAASKPGYYDAVLMDIRMPVMNGLEATQAIRALDRADAKKIIIVAMTANAFAQDVQKSKDAGMDGHLAKPIVPRLLFETLDALITGKR